MRFILSFLLLLLSPFAAALVIEPSVLEMTNEQQGAVVISNPSNRDIAIDVQVLEIDFGNNNELKELDQDLLVFPPAFLLTAGKKQQIRLVWTADKEMDQARSFYIRFETPVLQKATQQNGSVIDVQIDYNALVHISHKAHQPNINIVEQKLTSTHLELEVENDGQKYDLLAFYHLKNKNVEQTKKSLSEILGNVFFPPFSTKKLFIPLSLLAKDVDVKEKFSLVRITN